MTPDARNLQIASFLHDEEPQTENIHTIGTTFLPGHHPLSEDRSLTVTKLYLLRTDIPGNQTNSHQSPSELYIPPSIHYRVVSPISAGHDPRFILITPLPDLLHVSLSLSKLRNGGILSQTIILQALQKVRTFTLMQLCVLLRSQEISAIGKFTSIPKEKQRQRQ